MGREGDELRFDGRVAIVTGAGGQKPSLGEAYARLLASRGAKIVVNDLGVGPDGSGALPANAQTIAQEIVDAGGDAIADTNSVLEPESAMAVVRTALDAWGRIDVLVNNAGVVFFALFEEISVSDIRRIVDTHLFGSVWMLKAVWPHMKEAGYGRVVNISSQSIFGDPYLAVYGAAKAGIFGLTRGLALEGSRCGISVNVLAPQARTRKHPLLAGKDPDTFESRLGQVEQVAPVVAYLCHDRCSLNGAFLWAGSGGVREYRMYESVAYQDPNLTIEAVHANLDRIRDQTGAVEYERRGRSSFETMARRPYVPG
jgi:NAD(P)-dependent dehydrogenase (short-subunit alcohol dehydrogenase family)